MSGRPAATVTGHDPSVRPPHGLLVDELNGGIGLGLNREFQYCQLSFPYDPLSGSI
jgi:hypothetical protein